MVGSRRLAPWDRRCKEVRKRAGGLGPRAACRGEMPPERRSATTGRRLFPVRRRHRRPTAANWRRRARRRRCAARIAAGRPPGSGSIPATRAAASALPAPSGPTALIVRMSAAYVGRRSANAATNSKNQLAMASDTRIANHSESRWRPRAAHKKRDPMRCSICSPQIGKVARQFLGPAGAATAAAVAATATASPQPPSPHEPQPCSSRSATGSAARS